MSNRTVFAGIGFLFLVALFVGVVLYRTLSYDALLLSPYPIVPASSTVSHLENRSVLTFERVLATSTEEAVYAKTVSVGQVGLSTLFTDLRVTGEPVSISKITFTMRPLLGRDLHSDTVSRLVLRREDFPDDFVETDQRECTASECRFTLDAEPLFKGSKMLTAATPVRLRLEVNLAFPGIATLGDAFYFSISHARDVLTQTASAGLVTVINAGASLASLHVVPATVKLQASWPVQPVFSFVSSTAQIGVIEVMNKSDVPVYLDSVVLDIQRKTKGRVTFGLRASADGGNPNDVSVPYIAGKKDGVLGSLSSVAPIDLEIKPNSWRFISVFAEGDVQKGDVFRVSVRNIGDVRFKVFETDLGFSGNPKEDSDVEDLIPGLLTSGTPRLGEISLQ